jgi:lipopolysaccharide export system protein LptC
MKSTDWVGNLISIAIFSVLALASFGLSEYLARGRALDAGKASSGPNAIIENARVVRTDGLGRPQHRLTASRIVYNEREDRSILEKPVIVSLAANTPQTVIRADQAVATNQQNQIDLTGDVVITRDAFGGQPNARITTSKATVLVEEERAFTDAPVFVQRGMSTLQGVGLRFDQKTQKIDIISESRMVVPKENKK